MKVAINFTKQLKHYRFVLLAFALVFCFQFAKAQTSPDTLIKVITLDSGIVKVDTDIVIHNASFSVDGTNSAQKGSFVVDVANAANDITNGTKPGDIVGY